MEINSGDIIADGGDFVASASYTLKPRAPLSWLDPGVFGTLGVGAGFAMGSKLCHPDKVPFDVIASVAKQSHLR